MDQTILVAVDQSQQDILVAANKTSQLKIRYPAEHSRIGGIEKARRYSRVRYRALALIKMGLLELVDGSRGNLTVRITFRGMLKVDGC